MVPDLFAGRKVEPSAGLFPQLQVDHSLLLKDTKERVNSNGKTQMLFSCDMTFFPPNLQVSLIQLISVKHMIQKCADKPNCIYFFIYF